MICDINEILTKEDFALREKNYKEWENILIQKNLEEKYQDKHDVYILKYNRSNLKPSQYSTLGKYRSFICYKDKVLSFSPPKSLNYDHFIEENIANQCYAEDYIEGTMITVYYNEHKEKWEIATKSALGATVYFFNQTKTFDIMFKEACENCNFNIENLSKKFNYIFILQHPENRIVLPIQLPYIYLIKIYEIKDNIVYQQDLYKTITDYQLIKYEEGKIPVGIPAVYPINSYEELEKYFGSEETSHNYLGVMIYNQNGERTRIRNPNYQEIKYLRGNQPKLFYQYLDLRKKDKVKDYLFYYPESSNAFLEFRKILHRFTNLLWKNYINCFIKKEGVLKDYPFKYKIHMYNLHNIYITDKTPITKDIVIKYINNLDSAQILYAINYPL